MWSTSDIDVSHVDINKKLIVFSFDDAPDVTLKPLIQSAGYTCWYQVGDAAGKTMTVQVPEHGGFAVYDAAGLPVAASWAWGDTSAVLPEGGWVVFSGTPGARFVLSLTADEEK